MDNIGVIVAVGCRSHVVLWKCGGVEAWNVVCVGREGAGRLVHTIDRMAAKTNG